MKLVARYEISKWEVLMEHLDLLTESKFVVTTPGVVISHSYFVVQTDQSGDAESHRSNRR